MSETHCYDPLDPANTRKWLGVNIVEEKTTWPPVFIVESNKTRFHVSPGSTLCRDDSGTVIPVNTALPK